MSRQEQARATRAALIDAARELWSANGFFATSTSDIVTAAAVGTRGAFYAHFPDREQLFLAVLEDVSVRLSAELEQRVTPAGDPLTDLRAVLLAFLDIVAPRSSPSRSEEAAAVAGPPLGGESLSRRELQVLRLAAPGAAAGEPDLTSAPEVDAGAWDGGRTRGQTTGSLLVTAFRHWASLGPVHKDGYLVLCPWRSAHSPGCPQRDRDDRALGAGAERVGVDGERPAGEVGDHGSLRRSARMRARSWTRRRSCMRSRSARACGSASRPGVSSDSSDRCRGRPRRRRHLPARRQRQAARLRHRARGSTHHGRGRGARHARVHGARADAQRTRRRALGSVLVLRHGVGSPLRRAPVRRP